MIFLLLLINAPIARMVLIADFTPNVKDFLTDLTPLAPGVAYRANNRVKMSGYAKNDALGPESRLKYQFWLLVNLKDFLSILRTFLSPLT